MVVVTFKGVVLFEYRDNASQFQWVWEYSLIERQINKFISRYDNCFRALFYWLSRNAAGRALPRLSVLTTPSISLGDAGVRMTVFSISAVK